MVARAVSQHRDARQSEHDDPRRKVRHQDFQHRLCVFGEQALVWRGPMLHSAIRQFLQEVAWDDLDYLIIDMPPGTGDSQLSLAQTAQGVMGVIVTTPQLVSMGDALKGIAAFEQLKIPIIGVIENMGPFVDSVTGKGRDVWRRWRRAIGRDEESALLG